MGGNRVSSQEWRLRLQGCIHLDTLSSMLEVRKTTDFAKWIDGLTDIRARARARARVLARIERLAGGNPGDVKPVGEGVSEMRIHYGPGYRVYYKKRGRLLVILLADGDKRTQSRDIKTALRLAHDLEE
jgi:putative addiction module killer protein